MSSIARFRCRSMVSVVADGSLCVLELSALSLLFGMDSTIFGPFSFFFLTHFFLTGVVLSLIVTKLTMGEQPVSDLVIIGVVADSALLLLAWRFRCFEIYIYYPIASLAVFLISLKWQPLLYERTSVSRASIVIQPLLVLQIIPPLLWVLSPLRGTGHEIIDQIYGVQAVSHWPPQNLIVADLPYSNNYMLHLLLGGIHTATKIDLVLLVTRLSPIFLSWLFARSLFYFCRRCLNIPPIVALLPGFAFFIVFGYSPVIGHIFGTPTVIAAIWVQSPLFSFSIMLLIITIQSFLPKNVLQKCLILPSIFVAAFVGTGARAQLGPIIICAQSLLLLQALANKNTNEVIWRTGVLVVILIAVGAAIVFFLTVTSGFTGVSFLKFEANPTHFIIEQMTWFYAGQWFSDLGMAPVWAAAIAFIIIIVMQSSFLLPGFVWFIGTCWRRGFAALSPAEVLLLGTVIAGISAVSLTEAPGGSHYVFLHFSKIAAIVLGAIGFSDFRMRMGQRNSSGIICIVGGTVLLAMVHLIDICADLYREGLTNVATALKSNSLPDAELVSSLKHFFDNYDDRNRSVFIYSGLLSRLDSYVLPVQLGLQIIGDQVILTEYTKWESNVKSTLQRRLCLIKEFDKAVKDGFVDGNLVYALGSTLLRSYDAIYVIVPSGTTLKLPKTFEIRTGPGFKVYRVPMTAVAEQTKRDSVSDIEGCPDHGAEGG
jgi:hypothetical protein